MKFRLLLILAFLQTTSFAQQFGVDLGHAFTMNRFKNITSLHNSLYIVSNERQYLFPNASFRPYFRIYKKIYGYVGVDLCKYRFRQAVYETDLQRGYSGRLIVSEFHTPFMIRVEMFRFKQKHSFSAYGGVFARFLNRTQGNSFWSVGGYDSIPEKDLHINTVINDDMGRSLNLIAGIHQAFYIRDFAQLYTDLQVKYMPGYIDAEFGFPLVHSLPMRIENKLAISLSIGLSFQLPDKEKSPSSNPARLDD